jgi:glycosyltransferase involved in cell wall biosynthesis
MMDFTAVVVVFNEADRLGQALESIRFVRELIVVDLGSTDGSLDIARRYNARILTHERPLYPNLPRQYGIRHATHEWIVTIDPDEDFPAHELPKIEAVIRDKPEVSGMRLPWQFYFAGRPLTTTVWGNPNNRKVAVVHRDRIRTTPYVHTEYVVDEHVHTFRRGEIDPVKHYWMRGWRDFLDKHRRYLQAEGERRYAAGDRFSCRFFIAETWRTIQRDLFKFRAITSPRGLMLTGFHAWYVVRSLLDLRRYERGRRDG